MRSTRPFTALVFLFAAAGLSGPASAQPAQSAALEKAKAKFEADSAKAEEALVASLDKALAKAKAVGNKAMVEKLTYEKGLFATQRIPPTAVPAAAYLKQRVRSQDALEVVYNGAIKDCLKNKNDAEAEALEKELNALVKATRGYGLALPDLETKTPVLIENKASGLVLELVKSDGYEKLQLAPKAAKKRPAQYWTIEREEKGSVIRNTANGHVLQLNGFTRDGNVIFATKLDTTKETPDEVLFKITEVNREVTITAQSKYNNGQLVSAVEKKLKGVTSYELGLERKEPTPAHLWTVTEAK